MAKRHTTSVVSTITNRDQASFVIYEYTLRSDLFLIFRSCLIEAADRKVFRPACAPGHNPSECLDNDVKQSMARRLAMIIRDAANRIQRRYIWHLMCQPPKMCLVVQTPKTRHAA